MPSQAVGTRAPDGSRLSRYLPLSLGVTLTVTVLPLAAISQLGPARSPLAVALHVAAAVAISVVLARVLAALWTRHEQSSDVVFGDLLIWGWARRALAERRLDATARQIEAPAAVDADRVALLRRMSGLLEARDPYTHGHSRRVARHAERIAREIGLPREQVARIRAAALVHDIGKVNVPRSILTKPDKLTDAEFALVKRHPGDGAVMVFELGDPELTAIVRHHHERMDGTGYPDGLAGGDIPVGARVIAVADTFDAITSTRAYRKPRTHKQALEILQREAGTQLDSIAVAAFVSYYAAGRSVGFASMVAAAPQRLISGLGGVQSGVAASVAPIAQTACGVGGVALIGACLGGPVLPASTSANADPHSAAARQFAAQAGGAAGKARVPHTADQADRRSHERDRRPVAKPGDQGSVQGPTDRGAPRSLRTPDTSTPGGGQSNPGSGGGGGSGGGATTPTVPDVPQVLSDVQTVLEPVTDNVQLPQLQVPSVPAPAPAPPIGVP